MAKEFLTLIDDPEAVDKAGKVVTDEAMGLMMFKAEELVHRSDSLYNRIHHVANDYMVGNWLSLGVEEAEL